MIRVSSSGSFNNTEAFFKRMKEGEIFNKLGMLAQEGVDALASATSVDSGLTASSWGYRIEHKRGEYSITWTNTNTVSNIPVAILLQYGHATKNGGWVEGLEYINPAIKPIFDKIAASVWKEVTKNG